MAHLSSYLYQLSYPAGAFLSTAAQWFHAEPWGQARASANAVSADGTSPLLCAVRADVAPLQAGVVKRWGKHVVIS